MVDLLFEIVLLEGEQILFVIGLIEIELLKFVGGLEEGEFVMWIKIMGNLILFVLFFFVDFVLVVEDFVVILVDVEFVIVVKFDFI